MQDAALQDASQLVHDLFGRLMDGNAGMMGGDAIVQARITARSGEKPASMGCFGGAKAAAAAAVGVPAAAATAGPESMPEAPVVLPSMQEGQESSRDFPKPPPIALELQPCSSSGSDTVHDARRSSSGGWATQGQNAGPECQRPNAANSHEVAGAGAGAGEESKIGGAAAAATGTTAWKPADLCPPGSPITTQKSLHSGRPPLSPSSKSTSCPARAGMSKSGGACTGQSGFPSSPLSKPGLAGAGPGSSNNSRMIPCCNQPGASAKRSSAQLFCQSQSQSTNQSQTQPRPVQQASSSRQAQAPGLAESASQWLQTPGGPNVSALHQVYHRRQVALPAVPFRSTSDSAEVARWLTSSQSASTPGHASQFPTNEHPVPWLKQEGSPEHLRHRQKLRGLRQRSESDLRRSCFSEEIPGSFTTYGCTNPGKPSNIIDHFLLNKGIEELLDSPGRILEPAPSSSVDLDPERPDEGWMAANLMHTRFANDPLPVSMPMVMAEHLRADLGRIRDKLMRRKNASQASSFTTSEGDASKEISRTFSAPGPRSRPESVMSPNKRPALERLTTSSSVSMLSKSACLTEADASSHPNTAAAVVKNESHPRTTSGVDIKDVEPTHGKGCSDTGPKKESETLVLHDGMLEDNFMDDFQAMDFMAMMESP